MNLKRKFAPWHKNEGANFALFAVGNSTKISASGQTCGQRRKKGLFNPRSREEQAHLSYQENARFREDLRENKRKTRVRYEPSFWSDVTCVGAPTPLELA